MSTFKKAADHNNHEMHIIDDSTIVGHSITTLIERKQHTTQ